MEETMYPRKFSTNLIKLFIAAAVLFSTLAFAPPAAAQTSCGDRYTVVRGDTLFKIARHCGTTVNALKRANPEIKANNVIYPNQVLLLPGAIIPGTGSVDTYVVQKGDTLSKLATRFNTTTARLLELNPAITNANLIYQGQRLSIPSSRTPAPQPGQTYVVQRGDTLRIIAARFGTTVDVLLQLNPSIKDPNKIFTGQKLTLPATVSIHIVVRGDTLRAIAAKYNTTVNRLLELNPDIKDPNVIKVGQVIRIS
jgi:LysM repeat protein